ISRATLPGSPGTASSSSRLALRKRSGEPKCCRMLRLRAGPTPGSSSRTERVIARSRRPRWNSIAKRPQLPEARRELTLAPVDHDQRGHGGEALVVVALVRAALALPDVARHPAGEDLGHGSDVILHGLPDAEAAVVGLLRGPALEHDHRGDGMGVHEIRDVEALDPHRDRLHPERLLEPIERLDAL